MKFEKIKAKAKLEFATKFERCASVPGAGVGMGGLENDPSYASLLPFMRMLGAERHELQEFADGFQNPQRWDWIANQAKTEGNLWQKMLLKAREEGVKIIDDWDVRVVGRLIDLFPECIAKQYRNAAVTCYMADNEDCDWMVEFDTSKHRTQPALHG